MPRGISNRKLGIQALTEIRQQACNFQQASNCIVGLLNQIHKCLDNESITAKEAEQAREFVAERMIELQKADHLEADKLGKQIWEERNRFLRLYYTEENRKWQQERGSR